MKERILTNWTFTRVLFLLMGSYMIVQSIMTGQWFGLVWGGYFASMGIFSYGCAGGNCFGSNCNYEKPVDSNKTITDVEFEEVKTK